MMQTVSQKNILFWICAADPSIEQPADSSIVAGTTPYHTLYYKQYARGSPRLVALFLNKVDFDISVGHPLWAGGL